MARSEPDSTLREASANTSSRSSALRAPVTRLCGWRYRCATPPCVPACSKIDRHRSAVRPNGTKHWTPDLQFRHLPAGIGNGVDTREFLSLGEFELNSVATRRARARRPESAFGAMGSKTCHPPHSYGAICLTGGGPISEGQDTLRGDRGPDRRYERVTVPLWSLLAQWKRHARRGSRQGDRVARFCVRPQSMMVRRWEFWRENASSDRGRQSQAECRVYGSPPRVSTRKLFLRFHDQRRPNH